jgi:HlyD family secretion protein
MDDLHARVNLAAEDADMISVGAHARVYGESGALIDEEAVVGKIYVKAQEVLSELGIYQKRVPVEIVFSISRLPRLGSDIRAEIVAEKKENALRVPDSARFEISKEQYVYVIDEDGKARLRKIRIGLEGEDFAEVLDGLSLGEAVILSPSRDIEDGASVKAE